MSALFDSRGFEPVNDATAWALLLGATADALVGDPRGWPHPVRAIGWLISRLEKPLRRLGGARTAGVVLAGVVVGITAGAAWSVLAAADRLGGPAPLGVRTLLVWWGLAARSLGAEARRAAEAPDLPSARRALAMIVGRDTQSLDRPEIARACVETVAENANDAVVAPLFWFALAGPVGMWAYKAVSTLDSMVGYKDERYRDLGWASARLDDAAAFVPARLTWLLIAAAALLVGERPAAALRIGWRDGRKHPSPNAAWGEAAMAGALGVRLGGPATYGGRPGFKPLLGDPGPTLNAQTVRRAIRLMAAVATQAVALAWAARVAIAAAGRA